MDFLKWGVGAQGNFKLIEFLCQKENLEELVRYSVAVPQDPENKDESYKYPLIAHELLCHSSMLAEALVEGGWHPEEPEDGEEEEEEDDELTNDAEDDDDVVEREDDDEEEEEDNDTDEGDEDQNNTTEQKKFTVVTLKSKVGGKPASKLMNKARLQISIDDDGKKESSEETEQTEENEENEETKGSTEEDDLNEREQPKQEPEGEDENDVKETKPETETEEAQDEDDESKTVDQDGEIVKVSDVFLNLDMK